MGKKKVAAKNKANGNGANLGFEAKLWLAADKLRNNMDAAEYKHVVLGLIFLKYISDSFEEMHQRLLAAQDEGADPEDADEYRAENVFWVPKEVGEINMASEDCAIGRGVAAVRHNSGSRSYTYLYVHSLDDIFARFEAEGTVFGCIGKKDFHAIRCIVPPREITQSFERTISPLDDRIETAERESHTLAAIRDALLPKLLSGKIRVADVHKLSQT